MLNRLDELIEDGNDFAFETTLATKSYTGRIKKAKEKGYKIKLLFFWLKSSDLAKKRVKRRVQNGGHNIPVDVIERRYIRGIDNLFNIYFDICDEVLIFDNTKESILVARKTKGDLDLINQEIWLKIQANRKK